MNIDKFQQQQAQFEFPYHYIPHYSKDNYAIPYRWYPRAFEYLCYQRHIQALVAQHASERILELGCGDGRFCFDLPEQRKMGYVGVDLSEPALRFAKAFNPNCSFVLGTGASIAGTFGLVVAIEVLEHVPDHEIPGFLEIVQNKLHKNGVAIICVPSSNKPLIEKHFRHYTLDSLCSVLSTCAPKLEFLGGQYIFRQTLLLSVWERLTKNRLFQLDIPKLRERVWHYCMNKCTLASASDGLHVVGIFRRC